MINSDALSAVLLTGAVFFSATNTWALLKDKRAEGVRPYSNLYFFGVNSWMALQFVGLEYFYTALVYILFITINGVNAYLIITYRWRKRRSASSVVERAPDEGERLVRFQR